LTVTERIGFYLLYLNIGFYLVSMGSGLACQVCQPIINAEFLNHFSFPEKRILLFSVILILVLGIAGAVAFFQCSLEGITFFQNHYSIATIPLWIATIFALRKIILNKLHSPRLNNEENKSQKLLKIGAGSILAFTVPLGFTLIALHFDFPSSNPTIPIAAAIVPFIPWECLLIVEFLRRLRDSFTCNWFRYENLLHSDFQARVILVLGRNLFMLGLLAVTIVFNVFIVQNQYSLNSAVCFGILWVFCFEATAVLQAMLCLYFEERFL
ncbi:MAG: hypothetical protein K2Z81_11980, partial [Cyanobacteria bacterium]|nr:hypothetical protein [Cyanobacteriota bacterium]